MTSEAPRSAASGGRIFFVSVTRQKNLLALVLRSLKRTISLTCGGRGPDIPAMAATALIPRTAPFGDDERASLDRVLAPASPTQRAWLAGFLAGLDAGQGAAAAGRRAAARRGAADDPVRERIRQRRAPRAGCREARPQERVQAEGRRLRRSRRSPTSPTQKRLVVIAATWGEGEPPARAARAYARPDGRRPRRASTASPSPCWRSATPPMRSSAPSARRSTRGSPSSARSARSSASIATSTSRRRPRPGSRATLETLAPPRESRRQRRRGRFLARAPAGEVSREPVTAEVIEHVNLNSSRSDKETIHLALGFEGAAPAYEPGDSLELFPENDPAPRRCGARRGGPCERRRACAPRSRRERDITTLSLEDARDASRPRPATRDVHGLLDEGRRAGLDRGPPARRPPRSLPGDAFGRSSCRR